MRSVTCVVVTYNAGPALTASLRSILASDVDVELIIVDNASTDGTVALARLVGARVIGLRENVGYGAACNQGISAASKDLVVTANQDINIEASALSRMVQSLVDAEERGLTVLVGPALLTPSGSLAESPHRLPTLCSTIISLLVSERLAGDRNRIPDRDCEESHPGYWMSAAFLLAAAKTWQRLGGFDERYFMYVEDVDLFNRAHKLGYHMAWSRSALVTHRGGRGPWDPQLYAQVVNNWEMYWSDRHGQAAAYVVRACAIIGFTQRGLLLPLLGRPHEAALSRMFLKAAWRLLRRLPAPATKLTTKA